MFVVGPAEIFVTLGSKLLDDCFPLSPETCIRRLLREVGSKDVELKKHNIFFSHGDVLSAKTFDPFTHVYMFDVGET